MESNSLLVLVAGIVTGASGCGGGSASSTNSTLAITTISPTRAPAGGAPFVLAVQGTNFVPGSVINFGNMPITPAYFNSVPSGCGTGCSATQLSATIPAAAITTPGAVPVTVTNPAGGGTSNAVNFAITSGPYPEMDISINPTGALAGSPGFTLELIVGNFLAGSVVRWNGSDRPTTASLNYADSWRVEAQIPASDIAAPGTAAITVFNPALGAGSSTVTFAIAAHGLNPSSVAVDPAGKFAYVTNFGTDNVLAYAINTDGTLTFKGTIAAGTFPVSIAVHRSGKFAYVANWGGTGAVSTYVINTDGTLTFEAAISSGLGPDSVALDPSGKFAYVANEGSDLLDGSVSMYTIDTTTGTLTPNGTISPAPGAMSPESVAVDPSGKFAYVANQGGFIGSVLMYTIDATTGTLTPNGEIGGLGTFIEGNGRGNYVVFDPSGRFAYVVDNELVNNTLSGRVSMYGIDATTGKLTSMGTVDAGGGVLSLAVHPSGNFAYATADAFPSPQVSVYTLNATTGVLASNGTAPTERIPQSIAIDPSGKFAYVANYNSHSISMYTIDAVTGTLTLIRTIGT